MDQPLSLRNLVEESPLDIAIHSGSLSCMRLLLEADCELTTRSLRKVIDYEHSEECRIRVARTNSLGENVTPNLHDTIQYESAERPGPDRLEAKCPRDNVLVQDWKMFPILVDALISRRENIRKFALSALDESERLQLGLDLFVLPDANANSVVQRLSKAASDVPNAVAVRSDWRTVCHHCGQSGTTLDMMQRFWDAGFRDVDYSGSESKLSPFDCIMSRFCDYVPGVYGEESERGQEYIVRQLSIANWLLSRGALGPDLTTNSSCEALNGLAARFDGALRINLDAFLYGKNQDSMKAQSAVRFLARETPNQLLSILFRAGPRDCCECHCSPQGCSGLSVYLRECNKYAPSHAARRMALKIIEDQLSCDLPTRQALIPEIIRVETFELMELRHTCCKLGWGNHDRTYGVSVRKLVPMSSALVEEIHDEYSEVIERFESLVPKLIDGYWKSGLELLKYLDGPYMTRMDEVLGECFIVRKHC